MDSQEKYRSLTLQIASSKVITNKLFKDLLRNKRSYKTAINITIKANIAKLANLNNIKSILRQKGINYICCWEESYPVNLKNISDPPIVIFYKGNKELFKNVRCISIVGSRRMSSYGKRYTNQIVKDLKGYGFYIVSGMANGIDSVAHYAALENNIPTIAVLASSVDEPTPLYNTYLYNKILDSGGLILSETPPGGEIHQGSFPRRNRIIAGLSKGTVVIEANKKSGALITARLAQDYDREVFSIPGSLDSIYSVGSNTLIKENKAKLIQDAQDILIEFLIEPRSKIDINLDDLNQTEVSIYKSIENVPRLPEDIANFLNMDFSVIISSCSIMEINGYISKNERGEYFIN